MKRINMLPEEMKSQYSIARKEVEDTLIKANQNLANRMANVLQEQNIFIQQIHDDLVGKLSIKQQPLLTRIAPIDYTGNDNYYSMMKTMPDQLLELKSLIQSRFINTLENIASIDKKLEQNEGLVKLCIDNRSYFQELTTHLEKNMANQLVELMNLYWEEKNHNLEIMLDIARNTWKSIDENRNYLAERAQPWEEGDQQRMKKESLKMIY
jgi:hypothetical protein